MINNELPPCPFCGSGALKWKKHGKTYVSCIGEGCPVSDWSMSKAAWAARKPTKNAIVINYLEDNKPVINIECKDKAKQSFLTQEASKILRFI